jgi:hypothetical protein
LTFFVAVVAATPVLAAPPAEIEDLIRRGGELRRKGLDSEALPLYQRAHELAGTPRTAAQLGLVETQLGYRLEAERHLGDALAARNEPWIERYRKVLEETLRKVRDGIGSLILEGSPAGADVLVNGRPRGQLPLASPLRVVAGPADVELRCSGYTPVSAKIVIRERDEHRLKLNLTPLPSVPIADAPAAKQRTPAGNRLVAAPSSRDQTLAPRWETAKITGATLLGAGLLAIAAGGTLLLFDKHPSCDRPSADDQCDRRLQTRVPAWTLIGSGALAGGAGGFLLFRSAGSPVAVSVAPSSLFVGGRF